MPLLGGLRRVILRLAGLASSKPSGLNCAPASHPPLSGRPLFVGGGGSGMAWGRGRAETLGVAEKETRAPAGGAVAAIAQDRTIVAGDCRACHVEGVRGSSGAGWTLRAGLASQAGVTF